jgi:hypothetical protein
VLCFSLLVRVWCACFAWNPNSLALTPLGICRASSNKGGSVYRASSPTERLHVRRDCHGGKGGCVCPCRRITPNTRKGSKSTEYDHHILHCTLTSPLSPEPPNPAQLAPSHAGAHVRKSTRTRASFTAILFFITHSPPPPHPASLALSRSRTTRHLQSPSTRTPLPSGHP